MPTATVPLIVHFAIVSAVCDYLMMQAAEAAARAAEDKLLQDRAVIAAREARERHAAEAERLVRLIPLRYCCIIVIVFFTGHSRCVDRRRALCKEFAFILAWYLAV